MLSSLAYSDKHPTCHPPQHSDTSPPVTREARAWFPDREATCLLGFQVALLAKNLPASVGDLRTAGSIPAGKIPRGGHTGSPLQYSLEESHGQRESGGLLCIGSQSQTWLKRLRHTGTQGLQIILWAQNSSFIIYTDQTAFPPQVKEVNYICWSLARDPRLFGTRKLMMLTPSYLTTSQSEECP